MPTVQPLETNIPLDTLAAINKQLIKTYVFALSGQRKTPEMVSAYVSDPALINHIQEIETAFPEYELLPQEIIAEGNLVAMRALFRGVHRGAFAGVAATGKPVSARLMIMYRIENGRIAQHWLQFDLLGLLEQIKVPI